MDFLEIGDVMSCFPSLSGGEDVNLGNCPFSRDSSTFVFGCSLLIDLQVLLLGILHISETNLGIRFCAADRLW